MSGCVFAGVKSIVYNLWAWSAVDINSHFSVYCWLSALLRARDVGRPRLINTCNKSTLLMRLPHLLKHARTCAHTHLNWCLLIVANLGAAAFAQGCFLHLARDDCYYSKAWTQFFYAEVLLICVCMKLVKKKKSETVRSWV